MTNSNDVLHVAQIVPVTEAEGPGKRFALWFQGCPLRCPGCCNPEMLPFNQKGGMYFDQIVDSVADAMSQGIEGITLLGGEPTAHAADASRLARQMHDWNLSVMLFSGFTFEDLKERKDRDIDNLLAHTDILVDGAYVRELPETRRRWVGSSNQRVLFLTDRYRPDDPRWLMPNTLEIRLCRGSVSVNGFPTPGIELARKPGPTNRTTSKGRKKS